jgi:glycerol-3-phosphate O-acyltransferase
VQNYVRNLINFDISVVGHLENFDKAAEYLARGDNVIMLANHQTEADPGEETAAICDCHALVEHLFMASCVLQL